MNKISIVFILFLFTACSNNKLAEHGHPHGDETHTETELEPLAYTIYSDKSELFVKFKPLIVGETSKFAAHFTILGETFLPLTEGKVAVSLILGENGIKNSAKKPSSPGIFRLALKPTNAGKGKLIFDIETKDFSDKIIIENISVYPNAKETSENPQENVFGEEISYLKEQAWKVEFANTKLKKQAFSEIIKTTGQILSAQGDERILTAKNSGIITFTNSKKMIGSAVYSGENMFNISGESIIDNNLDAKYTLAKANYEKAKTNIERANELVKDQIISQKDFHERQLTYENAKTTFNNIANSYTTGGQKVKSPIKGYIKNLLVSEGQYVEIGHPIASVSQNRKLILKAEISQKHFSKLNSISSANFKMAYDNKVYKTDDLNGKLISYGKNTNNNAYYIPVNFEIDNKGDIIPGSFIEIYLKTTVIKDALVIPYSALIEEQGNYYAYVQTSGEGFQKRELELGVNDGIYVQVLSGIRENERVVTKGAYQIKLATMSGKMPAHGHEH
ncbi:MAG TPA: efflux RND transporter periplasmic adaptor subunit [Flavobacteriaceae bacterium]|nr:efflux RND transporter periplasmic adaptor subunit [Flavobacteriaceae bacterium]